MERKQRIMRRLSAALAPGLFVLAVWAYAEPRVLEAEKFTIHHSKGVTDKKQAKYPVAAKAESASGGKQVCFGQVPGTVQDKPYIETELNLAAPGDYILWVLGSCRKDVRPGDFVVSIGGKPIGSLVLPASANDQHSWFRLDAKGLQSGVLRIQRDKGDGYAFIDVIHVTDDPSYKPPEPAPTPPQAKKAPKSSGQGKNAKTTLQYEEGATLPKHVVHSKIAGVEDETILKWPAPPVPVPMAESGTPVFPGAKGFGVYTRAGRGGKILRVTNLNGEGPGSFREALMTTGPRTVVFEVGGVIDLGKSKIKISEPLLTVAGQTAPSPGITVIRGGIDVLTHDVLLRHIRVRPGDNNLKRDEGGRWETDGMCAFGPSAVNIVIDHCSVSWATDENLSISGPRYNDPLKNPRNVTLSHCIVAEGLWHSVHSEKTHSMGSLIHGNSVNIAVIGCLYAHNGARNPRFGIQNIGVIVNNFIYNPYKEAINMGMLPAIVWMGKEPLKPSQLSIVGNVLVYGENTFAGNHLKGKNIPGLALVSVEKHELPQAALYLEDNVALDREGKPAPLTAGPFEQLKKKPVWPEGLAALPASQVEADIQAHAGARPKDRDEVDKRILKDLKERKGHFIDSQNDVGGYPKSEMVKRPLQVPEKGVDEWLAAMAAELE